MSGPRKFEVIVVGAGFGGVAATIELKKQGFEHIAVLDSAAGIGGTWRQNTYPGAACDVPSHLYSYSFAQRTTWSRFCSPQSEILAYLMDVADAHDVTRHVVTKTRVIACRWSDSTLRWSVDVENEQGRSTLEADALVLATGQLNRPAYPEIEGIEDFAGTSFHSARWNHDYDLAGKKVAVIGTGASAAQFVPEIGPKVEKLSIFQRSGNWFLPFPAFLMKFFDLFPFARPARRGALFVYLELLTRMIRNPRTFGHVGRLQSTFFMRSQLKGLELRKRVWPTYPFGCKRVLISSDYLPAIQKPNVSVITDRIVRITPRGPQTEDGRVHDVDCVIFGTGFRATEFMFPMDVSGAGGRSLRDAWAGGARAHLGITMPGFPSLFVMYGPNTNTSGGSIIFFLEAQARYIAQAITVARDEHVAVDVRPEVEGTSTALVQGRFAGTAWETCASWYLDASGRNVANWPGYMGEYARATARFDRSEYRLLEGNGS